MVYILIYLDQHYKQPLFSISWEQYFYVGEFSTFHTTSNMEDQASAHTTKDSEFPMVILATTAIMEHKNLHRTWGECNTLLLHIFHKA